MGMSCGLYFDLALCTEPHSLTSDCIRYPGQASWLWMMASPFLKCQVCYGKKILWLSRSQAPIDLCAGMCQFHTGEKNTTQTNTPTPPKPNHQQKNVTQRMFRLRVVLMSFFGAIDLCVTWLPTVLPACEKPRVCTEAEFAYEERVSMLLPSCVF